MSHSGVILENTHPFGVAVPADNTVLLLSVRFNILIQKFASEGLPANHPDALLREEVERLRVAHVGTSLRHRESEVCKSVAAGRRFVIKMDGGVKWGDIELRFDLLLCHGHRLGERIWAAECHGGHFDDSKCC